MRGQMSGPSDLNLWHRIEGYNFDQPDINLPFSARLARENGWPPEFAQRVVEEYKKFVYLMCVSDEMLTPSQEVDEAWHLHLVYTRSYWDNFCRGVLGRDIHHEPTEGGAAENAKFHDCYRRTKERYQEEFGTMPPSDIWPGEQIRYGDAERHTVVETSRLPYVTKSQLGTAAFYAFFVLWAGWSLDWNSSAWMLIVGMAAFVAVTRLLPVGRPRRNRQNANGGGCGGGGGGCGDGGGGCGGGGE